MQDRSSTRDGRRPWHSRLFGIGGYSAKTRSRALKHLSAIEGCKDGYRDDQRVPTYASQFDMLLSMWIPALWREL